MSQEQFVNPWGWFPVAFSRDLKAGRVMTVRLAGADVVLYRTRAGVLRAIKPVCPHLGAHLGGAHVAGESLVCPFHGFSYDVDGLCVATPYGTPPKGARTLLRSSEERNGYIFVWHHENDLPPSYSLPDLSAGQVYSTLRLYRRFTGKPIDPIENFVDLGHFQVLHSTRANNICHFVADGPRFSVDVEITGFFGVKLRTVVHGEWYGTGFVDTRFSLPQIGLTLVDFAGFNPLTEKEVEFRQIIQVAFAPRTFPLARWALRTVAVPIAYLARLAIIRQVEEDLRIWGRRTQLEHPRLAHGDGPVMAARRWVDTFYHTADVNGSNDSVASGSGSEDETSIAPRN